MRKILATLSLATALVAGVAAPSFAEGDYVSGPTASGAWTQADASRTPLAGASSQGANFDMSRQGA
ncbi:hypothetical protein SAMN02745194_02114 [Roseomonas rosea]|uniref:Uncharacterized protein n=1 Tax=Muricoccus roseus TaxID=198092 RepID=A0A1M6HSG0_9PROT|nr:hypothetical protein [Roseomonas rosea]SHJ25139.1 hypothetical protein SAMN02745194_02114 [Roseomonas rosea]